MSKLRLTYQGNQAADVAPIYGIPNSYLEMLGGKERTENLQGYNSNSYVHGLVEAAGGQSVHPSGVKTPLYENAVPKDFFTPQPLP